MIFFTRSLTITILSFSFTLYAESLSIMKNDGSYQNYQLLPVKLDPSHAKVVAKRIVKKPKAMPDKFYIPVDQLPAVRDQGRRGTCAYFATVGILEKHYFAKSARLSEECLVDVRNWMHDQGSYTEPDKPGDRPDPNGDYPTLVMQTVFKHGVPAALRFSSADCIYRKRDLKGTALPLSDYQQAVANSPEAYGKALKYDENNAPTIDDIKAAISSGNPVEVAVFVYKSFQTTADWIFDPERDTDSSLEGGHAIQLTGYTTLNGKTVFTFKNSWGDNWGYSGFGTLDEGLLKYGWSNAADYDFILSIL